MGFFVAYRHTGADPDYLNELLTTVRDAFSDGGHEIYCTFFDTENVRNKGLTPRKTMEHAFFRIEEIGKLFVLIDGPEKSDGQIMEVGFCLAKGIPFVVAKRNSVNNTYIDQMTDNSFGYDDLEGLKAGIKELCEVHNGVEHNRS